jgi:hypothetical protein
LWRAASRDATLRVTPADYVRTVVAVIPTVDGPLGAAEKTGLEPVRDVSARSVGAA